MAEGAHGTMDDKQQTEHNGNDAHADHAEKTPILQRVKGALSRHALQEPGHVADHGHGGHGGDGADLQDLFRPAPTVPDTISEKPEKAKSDAETGLLGEQESDEKPINRIQAIYDFIKDVEGVDDILGKPEDAIDDRGLIKFSYVAKLGGLLRTNHRLREKVIEHLKRQESEGVKFTDTYLPEIKDEDAEGNEPQLTKKEENQLQNLEYTFKQIMENSNDPEAMHRAKQDLEDEGVRSLLDKIKYSKRWRYYSMAGAGMFTLIFLALALQLALAKAAASAGGKGGGRH